MDYISGGYGSFGDVTKNETYPFHDFHVFFFKIFMNFFQKNEKFKNGCFITSFLSPKDTEMYETSF